LAFSSEKHYWGEYNPVSISTHWDERAHLLFWQKQRQDGDQLTAPHRHSRSRFSKEFLDIAANKRPGPWQDAEKLFNQTSSRKEMPVTREPGQSIRQRCIAAP
jgi:hypothetical protein